MKPLSQLSVGQKARIEKVRDDAPSANLLSAMGLLPGMILEVIRFAPLGDPITVSIEGQQISLRKADAADVTVKEES